MSNASSSTISSPRCLVPGPNPNASEGEHDFGASKGVDVDVEVLGADADDKNHEGDVTVADVEMVLGELGALASESREEALVCVCV